MKKLLKIFFPNYSKNFMNDDIGELLNNFLNQTKFL